jgi:hypothetical protein
MELGDWGLTHGYTQTTNSNLNASHSHKHILYTLRLHNPIEPLERQRKREYVFEDKQAGKGLDGNVTYSVIALASTLPTSGKFNMRIGK